MVRQNFINRGQRLSPSARKIIKLRQRAFQSGGASLELQVPTNYIREISRDLNYDITSDASIIMTPNTIGESRLFNCKPDAIVWKNLLLHSDYYSSGVWSKPNAPVSLTNNVNYFNTSNSFYLTDDTNNTNKNISQPALTTAGVTYTGSVYVRKRNHSWIQLTYGANAFGSNNWINFNFDTGLFGNKGSAAITYTADSLSDGWWKLSLSAISSLSSNNTTITVASTNNTNSASRLLAYIGTNTQFLEIGGTQLEVGSIATTYQRTGDGIIDFQATRATTATVVQKDGSIGDSCYNLHSFSEDISNAAWAKTGTTATLSGILNNFNRTSSYYLNENTASSQHYVTQNNVVNANTRYVVDIYLAKADHTWVQLLLSSNFNNNAWVNFNFDTGEFGQIGTSVTFTYSKTRLINGFWKISLSDIAIAGGPQNTVTVSGTNNTDTSTRLLSYLGASGKICNISGMQLVQGSTPKEYLKTTNRLNVPSVDYSLGSDKPALLVEPQRTNLLLQSENFSAANWSKDSTLTVTANATQGPYINSFASKLTSNTNTNSTDFRLFQQPAIVNATNYAFSFYIKKAELNYAHVRFVVGGATNYGFCVNLNDNTVTTGYYNGPNAATMPSVFSVSSVNGYILVTISALSTGTTSFCGVACSDSLTTTAMVNSSGKGYYIWGAQLEVGTSRTSYIPTTTATVTRNAYTSYVDMFNNSLLNKDNFTLYVEGYMKDSSGGGAMIGLSETSSILFNNNVFFYVGGFGYVISGSQTIVNSNTPNNTYYRIIIQRSGTSIKFFKNGIQIGSAITIPIFDYRYLVISDGGQTYYVQKLALWKRTLSDADCVLLTN